MAEVEPGEHGAFLFVENHCPICVAASECQGFCAAELDLFRSVLGPGVAIEREDHIVAGARRCAYCIRPAAADAPPGIDRDAAVISDTKASVRFHRDVLRSVSRGG